MATAVKEFEARLDKAMAAYFKSLKVNRTEPITFESFIENKMLIIRAIRAGIPNSLFSMIQEYTPFSEAEWADFLSLSTKSLQRYRASSEFHFKPIHSEKIIALAEFTKIGLDVFGTMEKLKLWLDTPNYALGRLKPKELLKDSYGKEMVISELIRIDHGILA